MRGGRHMCPLFVHSRTFKESSLAPKGWGFQGAEPGPRPLEAQSPTEETMEKVPGRNAVA